MCFINNVKCKVKISIMETSVIHAIDGFKVIVYIFIQIMFIRLLKFFKFSMRVDIQYSKLFFLVQKYKEQSKNGL